jgi:hypothetical protein
MGTRPFLPLVEIEIIEDKSDLSFTHPTCSPSLKCRARKRGEASSLPALKLRLLKSQYSSVILVYSLGRRALKNGKYLLRSLRIMSALITSDDTQKLYDGIVHFVKSFLQSVEQPQHEAVNLKFETMEIFAPDVSGA